MPPKHPEPLRKRVADMRRAGKSYSAIKKEVGISEGAIAGILKDAGLTKGRKPAPQTPMAGKPDPFADLMPARAPPRKEPAPQVKPASRGPFQCGDCGASFTLDAGEEMPGTCPGCGEVFA